jgi:hypothetical protein
MADFAADVELIFSNAMEFNREATPIYDAAVTLKVSLNCHFQTSSC